VKQINSSARRQFATEQLNGPAPGDPCFEKIVASLAPKE
jgi:hypothetical protein